MPDGDGGLTVGQRIGLLETSVVHLNQRIDAIEGWRDELRGAMALVRFTLGTSIVSGTVAIVSLVLLLAGQTK